MTAADHARRIADAEDRGYSRGFIEGQQAAEGGFKARETQALNTIADALATCAQNIPREIETITAEALGIALAAARKLAPALMAQQPLSEITALLDDCLNHLRTTPHLVIRISAELPDDATVQLDSIIKTLADQHGFSGRIMIRHQPGLDNGDCSIDWAEGGIIRSREATEAAITALIENYVAARHAPPFATPVQDHVQEHAQEHAQKHGQGDAS